MRPRLTDPGVLVATVGGIGWLPAAPGSWASLAALPVGWAVVEHGGAAVLAVCCIILFPLGLWACGRYAALTGTHDASACVIDEVVGQWIVLLATPTTLPGYAAAFVIFRTFDILKPWPAGRVDRTVDGGLGVMLDDLVAGVQGAAVMWVLLNVAGVPF